MVWRIRVGQVSPDRTEIPFDERGCDSRPYHPRYKDSHTTYFEGISTPPKSVAEEDKHAAEENEKKEQKEQYAKRQAKKYERMAEHSLDPENQKKYEARAEQWEEKSIELREGRLPNSEFGIETEDERSLEKQKDIIKPRNLYKNLQKTDIGRRAWDLIQNSNASVKIRYDELRRTEDGMVLKGFYDPAKNEIIFFCGCDEKS